MERNEIDNIVSRVIAKIRDAETQETPQKTAQEGTKISSQNISGEKKVVLKPVRGKSFVLISEDVLKKLTGGEKTLFVEGRYIVTPSASDFMRKNNIVIEVVESAGNSTSSGSLSNVDGAVAIGSDHRGFSMKEFLKSELTKLGYKIIDVGTTDSNSCDYPDFAGAVGEKVSSGEAALGIVIDSAGIGSAIAANKVMGVRAAVCWDETTAKQAKLHNNANIMCIGADNIAPQKALSMAKIFIGTQYVPNERYDRRIEKIEEIEKKRK